MTYEAPLHDARNRSLQAELDAVGKRPWSAEREDAGASLRIVSQEARDHRGNANLCFGKAAAALLAAEVGVVHGRQQRPDYAGDRRMRDHVHLTARVSPN